MNSAVVIVAGGKGLRMGGELPKQFMLLNNLPILMNTITAFNNAIPDIQIVVVLPQSQINFWNELCTKHNFTIAHKVVEGGTERFHSVSNGLSKIDDNCIVGIHDGVRPLVSVKTILNCYKTAQEKGNAVPFVPIVDSLREINVDSNKMVDRSKYVRIQTPQVFKAQIIKDAFKQEYSSEFTDDASVLEKTGQKIVLVEGNEENIKITRPIDIQIAEAFLKS